MATDVMTPAEIEQLHELGYVVVEDLIDQQTLDEVCEEVRVVVDGHLRDMVAEGLLDEPFTEAGFERQLAKVSAIDVELARELIRRLWAHGGSGGHMGPHIFALMTYPRLLDAMEQLVGPELIGSSVYRIRPKAPLVDKGAVPWHQDSGYLLSHCDKELVITCWVPLVDADEANGCLHVIPGVHRRGILRHHTGGPAGYLIITEEDLPEDAKPIPVPVKRGSVLMLTNLTPHASFMNTSDHVRWSVDLRYQSATVPNNVDVRPEDYRPDMPDVEIACYPPEADCVLRSVEHPEKVIASWQELRDVRDRYFNGPAADHGRPGRWQRLETP